MDVCIYKFGYQNVVLMSGIEVLRFIILLRKKCIQIGESRKSFEE